MNQMSLTYNYLVNIFIIMRFMFTYENFCYRRCYICDQYL